jgi:hypothetical protein
VIHRGFRRKRPALTAWTILHAEYAEYAEYGKYAKCMDERSTIEGEEHSD